MHEYKFNLQNGEVIETTSKHHIQSMNVVNFNGGKGYGT